MFEVNLVPDVKAELLKAHKTRNFIIYISIMVAVVCGGVLIVLGSIVGGQGIALMSQDNEMKEKSDKILATENLNLNLTIQDQLNKLGQIGDNRKLLSRVFGILDVILPTGDDIVTLSELTANLPNSTLSFDAQANSTSGIDYRALEVFKKTVELSKFDYGSYIDKEGKVIPSYCVDEVVENGVIYGVYHLGTLGCGKVSAPVAENPPTTETPTTETPATPAPETPLPTTQDIKIKRDMTADELKKAVDENDYHFRSECIKDGTNSCLLVDEPVSIRESNNGRDSAGDLVLRFSAIITINRDVFAFNNKHMRIIGPTRQNVTDSYTQVRDMFTEEAKDCAPDDTDCLNANANANGTATGGSD